MHSTSILIGLSSLAVCVEASFLLPSPKLTSLQKVEEMRPMTTLPRNFPRGGNSERIPSKLPASLFAMDPFLQSQSIIFGANFVGYLLSLVTSSHYHVDMLGTGAFALAAIPSLLSSTTARVTWSASAVALWSIKLAGFLFFRVVQQKGHDNRLDEILSSPYYAAGFWVFSWLWGSLVSLPHTLGAGSTLPGSPLFLAAGAVLFGTGLTMETLADYQKTIFKRNNPGKFCNEGLWAISQHPNWCGNLVLWLGIFLMNAPALIEPRSNSVVTDTAGLGFLSGVWRCRRLILAMLGPVFLSCLFYSQASGALLGDALEATKKRYGYGKDPTYTKYIDNTPLLFPKLF